MESGCVSNNELCHVRERVCGCIYMYVTNLAAVEVKCGTTMAV